MNKKNNLNIYVVILIIILLVGALFIYIESKNLSNIPIVVKVNDTINDVKNSVGITSKNKLSGWEVGAWTNAYAANPGEKFDQNVFDNQINALKELGINHLRTNFEHNGDTPTLWANNLLVESAEKNNWDLTFIVEHPFQDFFQEASYESGYEWGKKVGSSYAGKVDYYQLANEVSGTIIESGNGLKKEDYNQEKYEILKNYLVGLREGIYESDPNAKFIVSAHWICLAVIDMLIEDGLEFDVIGWNWYSEMGDNLSNKPIDEGEPLDIPGLLGRYGKPFWIVELNQSGGDMEGEEKQANFFERILENSYKSGDISGIFVYRFADTICTEGDQPTSHLGIIKDRTSDKTKSGCNISDPKDAYYVLQDFINKLAK